MSGLYTIAAAGESATMRYVSFGCFALAAIIIGFSSRAITALGFEAIGYTKGRSTKHHSLVIYTMFACLVAFVPTVLQPGVIAANLSLVLVGMVVMLAFFAATVVINIAKSTVVRRNHLIDPIIHAISEGYPLK